MDLGTLQSQLCNDVLTGLTKKLTSQLQLYRNAAHKTKKHWFIVCLIFCYVMNHAELSGLGQLCFLSPESKHGESTFYAPHI